MGHDVHLMPEGPNPHQLGDASCLVPARLPPSAPRRARGAGWRAHKHHVTVDGVTYKIAGCREEREGAFRLMYEAYSKNSLMPPNRYQMRVTPHDLLHTTDLFIALHENQVICAMTLISDDFEKLPMQTLFDQEVRQQQEGGNYLAEISCMAARQDYLPAPAMTSVLLRLLSMIFQYGRRNDVDRILIGAHPRHFRLYRRCLGFVQIGPQRQYNSPRPIPVVACQHDFAELDTDQYPLYHRVYGHIFQPWELLRQPMLEDDRAYFRPVAQLSHGYAPVFASP